MSKIIFCRETLWSNTVKLSTQYIAEQFLYDGWDVLWITRPLNPGSLLRNRGKSEKWRKFTLWRRGGLVNDSGVAEYAPFTLLPYRNFRGLDAQWIANHSLSAAIPTIGSIAQGLGFADPDIVWLADLAQASIIRLFPGATSILNITDDYRSFPTAPQSVPKLEQQLAETVDIVFATHPDLTLRFKEWNRNTYFLPHGVDYESFLLDCEPPHRLSQIPAPRVVFLGAIATWMDWDLLGTVTSQMADHSFVFLGPITTHSNEDVEQIRNLRRKHNVYFLGEITRQEVPAYLQHCDVGIIPFSSHEVKKHSNPMKLFEYLACGLPTVSTIPFWNVMGSDFDDSIVYHANSTLDFVASIRQCLSDVGESRPKCVRQRFVTANSWLARYKRVRDIITGQDPDGIQEKFG